MVKTEMGWQWFKREWVGRLSQGRVNLHYIICLYLLFLWSENNFDLGYSEYFSLTA